MQLKKLRIPKIQKISTKNTRFLSCIEIWWMLSGISSCHVKITNFTTMLTTAIEESFYKTYYISNTKLGMYLLASIYEPIADC